MVIPCQTNYWGISAMPSVHSHDLWLKLSCENIVPVGKAVNCLCVWDLLLFVTDSGTHTNSLYGIERSGLRGLRGIFIHLPWHSVTKAVSFYMERLSYSQQCWIQCLWLKTLVHMSDWAFALSLLLQIPACSPAYLAGRQRAEMGDAQDMCPTLFYLIARFGKGCNTAILRKSMSVWVYSRDLGMIVLGTDSFNPFALVVSPEACSNNCGNDEGALKRALTAFPTHFLHA